MIVVQSTATRRQATELALALAERRAIARFSDLVEAALAGLAADVGVTDWVPRAVERRGRPDAVPAFERLGSSCIDLGPRIGRLARQLGQPASVVWSVAVDGLHSDVFDTPSTACA